MSEKSDAPDGSVSKTKDQADTTAVEVEPGMEKDSEKQDESGAEDGNDDGLMRGLQLVVFTIGMMAVMFLMCLDHYILATAVPRITTEFNALQDAAWYSSGYYLTNMVLQPAFGQMYALFSPKMNYLVSLVVFEAGSLICALAPSSAVLIVGRLISGVGGGGLYMGNVVFIGAAVPGRSRPLYIALICTLDGVASVCGPLLGGLFTDSERLTWRFCFWINLPIGFVAFLVLWWCLRDPPSLARTTAAVPVLQRLARVDWLSMTLLTSGFTMVLLALQWAGPVHPWSDPRVCGCLVGGGIALVLYFVYQHYQGEDAAIPYRVLRQRTVFFSAAFMLLMSMLIGALVYYLPFEFQAVRGDDATASGINNLAFLMPVMIVPLLSGAFISVTGFYVPLMYLGGALATAGSGLLITLRPSTPRPRIIAYQALAGIGAGLCHQIPYTSILHVVAPQDTIAASALSSLVNSLGAILGIVFSQAIFANVLIGNLGGVPGLDASAVLLAGPTNIGTAVPPSLVGVVRNAYAAALHSTYVLPAVAAGLSCISALGMEWKRIRS
ncbi:b7600399-3607-4cbf-822b-23deefb2825a [Thermothielavioides terrestris]|uniref:B7600399-3607-4cbf-822b-23deefb2825a n=1 Tax=Thermothielavioides terrestris TaxID=2587410 RepID=A0A446BPS3_9PEZI|nr:b7600399-3607-4cbf-822b-23deefb2825a [Thermothielavioides terrestris]